MKVFIIKFLIARSQKLCHVQFPGAKEQTRGRGNFDMLPCDSCGTQGGDKRVRVRSLKSSYVEKSKSHKEGKFLWECGGGGEGEAEKLPKELTSRLVYLNYLSFSISAFFDVKRHMHYIKFFLLKSHKHQAGWEKLKFESAFLLGFFLFCYIINFFYQSANDN